MDIQEKGEAKLDIMERALRWSIKAFMQTCGPILPFPPVSNSGGGGGELDQ